MIFDINELLIDNRDIQESRVITISLIPEKEKGVFTMHITSMGMSNLQVLDTMIEATREIAAIMEDEDAEE